MIVCANRTSAILFNLLRSREDGRPFLLPANICPVVPVLFHKTRVPFEFVDISEQDYCISQVEELASLVRKHVEHGARAV